MTLKSMITVTDSATLRQWRLEHNYTLDELGEALGVGPYNLMRWELGKTEPVSWGLVNFALKGLVFTHHGKCRCGGPFCRYQPKRYAANGRSYDPG